MANKMAEASKVLANQKGGFRLREIQNLAEMSKEESAMIIVYPFQSKAGEDIAYAAVALSKEMKTKRTVSKTPFPPVQTVQNKL